MTTKKIGIDELRAIIKEAIADHKEKKESASDKRIKTTKDKEKSKEKKSEKLSEIQLRNLVKESISKQISEMMASDTAKPKVVVPRPQMSMSSDDEVSSPSSSMPKEGDKVQLASGKEAYVAKVSGDMVFVTIDGIKMVAVPMDYVNVIADDPSSEFNAVKAPDESEDERAGTLDKYLDRPFLNKDTRNSLEKERGEIQSRRTAGPMAAAAAREEEEAARSGRIAKVKVDGLTESKKKLAAKRRK